MRGRIVAAAIGRGGGGLLLVQGDRKHGAGRLGGSLGLSSAIASQPIHQVRGVIGRFPGGAFRMGGGPMGVGLAMIVVVLFGMKMLKRRLAKGDQQDRSNAEMEGGPHFV